METIDFNITADRANSNSIKWNKTAIENISANENAKPFWVADMDFLPEMHIHSKAREIADNGIFGYPAGSSELLNAFTAWLSKRHNWIADSSSILFTMGLLHGIGLAIDLFTNKGDKILIPSPAYKPFRMLCEFSDRVMEDYPLSYDNGEYSLDRKSFRDHAEKCSLILFCSPHNPSGLVFSEDDLIFVLETAKELNIPVFSDEIHADLVHPSAKHIPMGKANEKVGAQCITFMAPSKTFNVAGEHSAFAVFSDKDMEKKYQRKQKALFLTTPGYVIGDLSLEAYKHGFEYNKELCKYLQDNATFIREYLRANCPEIKLVNGKASFVTFLDCSEVYQKIKAKVEQTPERYKGGKEGGVLSRFFGVEAGVAMNDGTWFGEQYYSFVRFNYGTSRELVKEAIENIVKAVKAL